MNLLAYHIAKTRLRIKYGVHLKPRYVLRLLRNVILAKTYRLLKINRFVLRGIDFAITYACTFNCSHCYAKKLLNPKRRKMALEDYRRIRDEATALGAVTFSLQGGEPFLARNLEEIVEAFEPTKNHVVITTNSSLLTEKKLQRLRKLGVDTICVSLDSGIREEHDAFRRRKGNFDKIMEVIDWCRKYGVKVIINTCVTKDSLYSEGFNKILEFAKERSLLVEVLFPRPLGSWEMRNELLLGEKEYAYYQRLEREHPFLVRDLSNNYSKYGCPALKEYFYITCYGDVCPCPFTHITLGNIFQEPLETIRNRGLNLRWWNHYPPECLTATDAEFMEIYYPLVQRSSIVTLKRFLEAAK